MTFTFYFTQIQSILNNHFSPFSRSHYPAVSNYSTSYWKVPYTRKGGEAECQQINLCFTCCTNLNVPHYGHKRTAFTNFVVKSASRQYFIRCKKIRYPFNENRRVPLLAVPFTDQSDIMLSRFLYKVVFNGEANGFCLELYCCICMLGT